MPNYTTTDFEGTSWKVFDGSYYVSGIGSDVTGDGSPKKPFLTVKRAVEIAGADDKIVVTPNEFVSSPTSVVEGSGAWLPCRAATLGDQDLSVGLAAVDGVLMQEGDRVLVWQQTNSAENGIYQVTSSSWIRSGDFRTNKDAVSGKLVPVIEGDTHAKKIFQNVTNGSVDLDHSPLIFESFLVFDWGDIQGNITDQLDLSAALDLKADKSNVLEKDNTTSFTPTGDHHPVTKKFMEDAIAALDKATPQGILDCSANPDYPAGVVGDYYYVSVAGKIGGASGVDVQQFDKVQCIADAASGNHATVGVSWIVMQGNLEVATQSEAEAGTDNEKYMTALRTKQAWDAYSAGFSTYATVTQKTAAYTLVAADNDNIIECDGTFTVTIPIGLPDGFTVQVVNKGAGTITLASNGTYEADGDLLEMPNCGAFIYHSSGDMHTAIGRLTSAGGGGAVSGIANLEDSGANVINSASGTGYFQWGNVKLESNIIDGTSGNLYLSRAGGIKLTIHDTSITPSVSIVPQTNGDLDIGHPALMFGNLYLAGGIEASTSFKINNLASGTLASDDLVMIQDVSDSNTIKTVTAQSIADLASGGGSGSGFSVTNESVNRLITSSGTGSGNAEENLTFDGTTLSLVGELDIDNLNLNGNTISANYDGEIRLLTSGNGKVRINSTMYPLSSGVHGLGTSNGGFLDLYLDGNNTGNTSRFYGVFTTDRIVTIPDKTGTLAFLDDIPSGGGSGFNGDYTVDDASTNTSIKIAEFNRTTSGTAADDIGGYIEVGVEDSTGSIRNLRFEHILSSVDATPNSFFNVYGFNESATESLLLSITQEIFMGRNLSVGTFGVAVGRNITAGSTSATFGFNSNTGNGGAAFGYYAQAGGAYHSSAYGSATTASADYASALGANSTASGKGSLAMGRSSVASALGAFMIGYDDFDSPQTNSLANSFELAWNGTRGFKTGLTLGTQVLVDTDPDTNLTDAENGAIAYDSTDHEFRAYVNGGWTALGGSGGGLANLEDSGANIVNSSSGTGSFIWDNLTFNNSKITATGSLYLNSTLGITIFNSSFYPASHNSLDIGNIGGSIRDIHIGGNIEASTSFKINNLALGTLASDDIVMIQDVSDTNTIKTVTAQSIADLAGGGGSGFNGSYTVDDASTNTSIKIAEFNRTTSGTAADGIGGYIDIGIEDSLGSLKSLKIHHELSDSGSGSDSMFRVEGNWNGNPNNFLVINSQQANGSYGSDSVGIGRGFTSSALGSVAVGGSAYVNSSRALAVGALSAATAGYATAIGPNSFASGFGSIAIGYFSKADAQGAIMMGFDYSAQTNSLANSFELAWNGTRGFKTGLTLGTQVLVDADPDTNLTDAENGAIAYDSTDHEFRAYVNGGWTALGGSGASQPSDIKVYKSANEARTSDSLIADTDLTWNLDADTLYEFEVQLSTAIQNSAHFKYRLNEVSGTISASSYVVLNSDDNVSQEASGGIGSVFTLWNSGSYHVVLKGFVKVGSGATTLSLFWESDSTLASATLKEGSFGVFRKIN
ncbi:MAG: hypothetical protein JXR03_01560 [Cyclobacteriaceae bacterium]